MNSAPHCCLFQAAVSAIVLNVFNLKTMQIIVLRLTSKMMRKIVPPAQLSGGQDNVDLPAGGSCQRKYATG
jgi:hypothetical protein